MNRHIRLPILLCAAVLLFTACSGGIGSRGPIQTPVGSSETTSPVPSEEPTTVPSTPGEPTPAPTKAPTAAPGETEEPTEWMRLKVYYFLADTANGDPGLVPVMREVPKTVAVGGASMRALLDGPEAVIAPGTDPAVTTAIPEGTLFLGLDIKDGLATVDLSQEFESGGGSFSMGGRLAQVVYTLTQFPTVERVQFRLDGEPVTVFSGEGLVLDEPVTREDYFDYLPPIFVDSPEYGDIVEAPIRIQGLSNVFEATFMAAIEDLDGNSLESEPVMATCGTGCWGAFDASLGEGLEDGDYYLQVWEPSAMDGSATNNRRYPIHVGEYDFTADYGDHGCGC